MLFILLVFAMTACGYSQQVNYKLTLNFEIDGEIHSGSTIVRTDWYGPSSWHGVLPPWNVRLHGEAAVIDLGPAGLLFALLTGPSETDRISGKSAFSSNPVNILTLGTDNTGSGGITPKALSDIKRRNDTIDLPMSLLPLLIHFRDLDNPLSAEAVDPRDPSAVLDHGARLLNATLQITDESPQRKIDHILKWLAGLHGGYLSGKHASSPGPLGTVSAAEFVMGED